MADKLKGKAFSGSRYHLAFLFAFVFLVCKAMEACYRIIGFNYIAVSILFFSGILLYSLYCMLTKKVSLKPAYLLLMLGFLAIIILLNLRHIYPLWDTYIIENFEAINMGIYTESETYFRQFLPFLVFLVPLTSAACWAFSTKGRAELSIVINSLYMFSLWNNGLDRLMARFIPFFILLGFIYISICKYDYLIKAYKNTDVRVTVTSRNIILYTVFIAIAVTLSATAASHIFGTKSMVQLKSDYDIREIRLENISKKSAFELYSYGYGSKGGKLGGSVQLDSLIALKVRAAKPAYLRGTVKDSYDGSSWSKSFDDYTIKPVGALITPNQDFNLRMTGNSSKKPDIKKVTVYPYGLATSTLFSPSNAFSVSAKGGKVIFDYYRSFMLMGKEAVNDSYTIKYYSSDAGIEVFEPDRDTDYGFRYDYGSKDERKKEYYEANIKTRYSTYLQIPQSITPRTYELVEDIIKDCGTTQDKAAAIMNYLSHSFPYSLNVSQVPENQDFIDYFLFSEKKGYCTYFATTAAMMFRLAGIPARYVEGFNMNDEKDSSGLYIVRNHRAHAWAEILISPESDLWAVADCVPQGASIDEISNSGQYRDRFADDRYKSINPLLAKNEQSGYNNDSIPDYSSLLGILLYPVFIIPALILLGLTVYIIYKLVLFKGATRKLMYSESIIPLYRHLTVRLESIGEVFPEECCELEYVKAMKDKELSRHMEIIVKACYEEHYGGIDNNASIDKKPYCRLFEKYMRKRQGFLKYWYCRIRYS